MYHEVLTHEQAQEHVQHQTSNLTAEPQQLLSQPYQQLPTAQEGSLVHASCTSVPTARDTYLKERHAVERSSLHTILFTANSSPHDISAVRMVKRQEAFCKTYDEPLTLTTASFHVTEHVQDFLTEHGYEAQAVTTWYGSHMQHALHGELVDLMTHLVALYNTSGGGDTQQLQQLMVDIFAAASFHNVAGCLADTTLVLDAGWAAAQFVYEVGIGGVKQGIRQFWHTLINLPETITMLAGSTLKAAVWYQDVHHALDHDDEVTVRARMDELHAVVACFQQSASEKLHEISQLSLKEILQGSIAALTEGALTVGSGYVLKRVVLSGHACTLAALDNMKVISGATNVASPLLSAPETMMPLCSLTDKVILAPSSAAAAITACTPSTATVSGVPHLTQEALYATACVVTGAAVCELLNIMPGSEEDDDTVSRKDPSDSVSTKKQIAWYPGSSTFTPQPPNPDNKKRDDHASNDESTRAKREQIWPQVDTYEQARNQALEIIGEVDPHTARPHVGHVGIGEGKITGINWHNKKVVIRLDWDLIKGPHVNVTDYRAGKGLKGKSITIPFKGDISLVGSLLRHLNTEANVTTAKEIFSRLQNVASLDMLQINSWLE